MKLNASLRTRYASFSFLQPKVTGSMLVEHIAAELGDASKAKYLGLLVEKPGGTPVSLY